MAEETRRERLSDVTVKMILTRPISAIDAAIHTTAKFVEDTSAALGALPSLARSLEQLRPGGVLLEEVVKLNDSVNRLLARGVGLAQSSAETVGRALIPGRSKPKELEPGPR
jgi:hypothetical protein